MRHPVALVGLIACLFGSAVCARAQTADSASQLQSDLSLGYHFSDTTDNPAKVNEYTVNGSGVDAAFLLRGNEHEVWLDIEGQYRDIDDQQYRAAVDISRFVRSHIWYNRFRHHLDNDPLDNQDYARNDSTDQLNALMIEELRSQNSFQIPGLPVKFTADYRMYSKRGTRQASTVSKCFRCHVSSNNRRVNSQTDDLRLGAETTVGPATIAYEHLYRTFTEHGDAPTSYYSPVSASYLVRGWAPYAEVPETRAYTNKISVRTRLPRASTLFSSYQWGGRTNRDTRNDVRFRNLAARLSSNLRRYGTWDLFYSNYAMHNDTPDALETDRQRGGVNINIHTFKKTGIKLSYIWQSTKRNNFQVSTTRIDTYRLSINRRLNRRLRFHLRLERRDTDNPFVWEDELFADNYYTSQPNTEDTAYVSPSWNPRADFSLSSNLTYNRRDSDQYDFDEDRTEFSVSCWYAPINRLTLTGSYTLYRTRIDTRAAIKIYHFHEENSVLVYNRIPYDDLSQSWYLGATLRVTPRLSLTGDFTFIMSDSYFDADVEGENIGRLSNIDINQVETSIGANYLLSRQLSFYATINYRNYNDKEVSRYDGTYTSVQIGMNWRY